MADGYCGKDFLIEIEDQGNLGTYIPIAALESNTATINKEQVEITNKTNGPWRTLLAGCGVKSMDVSGNGYVTDDATFAELTQKMLAGTHINARVSSGLGDTFTGVFEITTQERNGDYNSAEKYSISLASSGAITYVAPA